MSLVRVGLVGCGTIGVRLALTVQREYSTVATMTALHDVVPAQALRLQARLRSHPSVVSLPTLIRTSQLIIEAASAAVVPEVVSRALRAGRHVLVMSVGGLLRERAWQRLATGSKAKVYIPSGALAGLDGIKAMAVGHIRRVSLTTSKPPRALSGSPYVKRRKLDLGHLRRPTIIFEGSARAVVEAFPQNTNVAAALTLASGVSAQRTRVRVVADPSLRMNVHELDVESDCGRIHCRIESRASSNPKTSELAVRSAVASLRRLFDAVAIGT